MKSELFGVTPPEKPIKGLELLVRRLVSMAKTCILLLTLAVTALGQTSAELRAKFPQITSYKVRPDVLMTARFAADGQVCDMTLEKRQDKGHPCSAEQKFEGLKGRFHSGAV
jgi:hypothetical protein